GSSIPAGVTVNVDPSNTTTLGNMTLQLPSTFTNAGTLNLSATGQNHNIVIEGDTLANTGTLNINPGPTADGQRELGLSLNNSGTLNINASTTMDDSLTNTGDITIATGKSLSSRSGWTGSFTQSDGTLTINGSLVLDGREFYDNGGTIVGAVTLSSNNGSSALNFASTPASGGTFNFVGANTSTDNYYDAQIEGSSIPAGVTVNVDPSNTTTLGNMTLQLPSTFTNAGTLNLSATGQNHNIVIEGNTLTNTGTLNVNPGPSADGQRELNLFLNNSGDLNINASTTLNAGLVNSGTLTIGSNSIFDVNELVKNTGLIDLAGGELKIDYAYNGRSTILPQINAAYDHGAWDGKSGVGSSLASTHLGTGVGYGYVNSAYTVMYTWLGDTNLDGVVDGTDLLNMAPVGATNATWSMGDFNYDGIVNQDDYSLLLFGLAESGGINISTTLPEPTGLTLAAAAIVALLPRRRRVTP
ncbi:MAG TPA: hypothetical protein VG722_00360, partial [Tepidisphaeraceae bacterium]|nr:hypothetical protein [Tepidisphaeraceae bacterium]